MIDLETENTVRESLNTPIGQAWMKLLESWIEKWIDIGLAAEGAPEIRHRGAAYILKEHLNSLKRPPIVIPRPPEEGQPLSKIKT